MEAKDPRLFTKRQNTEIAQNIKSLISENRLEKEDIKYVLLFASVMQESEKLISASILEALTSEMITYVFKQIKDLPLDDVADTLQFLEGAENKKADKFLQRLQDHLTLTNPKLLKEPTATALIQFTVVFHAMRLGNVEFWKKMTSLLENTLKEQSLDSDELVQLFSCLASTTSHTAMISSEPLWRLALRELERHFNQGTLDF